MKALITMSLIIMSFSASADLRSTVEGRLKTYYLPSGKPIGRSILTAKGREIFLGGTEGDQFSAMENDCEKGNFVIEPLQPISTHTAYRLVYAECNE